MQNKIIEKIQKLIKLAQNSGATEGERDNALRMAHGLLAKHNISMLEVEQLNAEEKRETVDYASFSMPFCGTLAVAISKLFFCKAHRGAKINGTKQKYYFTGKTSNATTARLMHEYIVASILKECRSRWKHNLAPESRAFALGAASKVLERVKELMEAPIAEAAPGTSLVVVNLYKTEDEANSTFLAASGVRLVASKSGKRKSVNTAAYEAGKAYGGSISLHGQVSGSVTGALSHAD